MNEDRPGLFERNRYFTGKLLTAQDFTAEQNYFMEKRRLVNRMLFGTGIVCGLNVVKVDDMNIAVEPGMAFDADGREIVVSQSLVKKLSHIEGYEALQKAASENDSVQSAFLCLEYKETKSEPIFSASSGQDGGEGQECNKVKEEFAFRLTTVAPPCHPAEAYDAAVSETALWDDGVLRITMSAPRFINAGREFYLETHIFKGASRRPVNLAVKAELRFLTAQGRNTVEIEFNEPEENNSEYRIQTLLKACSASPQEGEIRISGIELTIGNAKETPEPNQTLTVNIAGDASNALLTSQWDKTVQSVWESRPEIYLAKFHLIVSPLYYSIEHIENRPFGQTVLNAAQAQSLITAARYTAERNCEPPCVPPVSAQTSGEDSHTGNAVVNIPAGAKKGSIYSSNSIPHGLGPGTVFITAGLLSEGQVLTGNGAVFDNPFIWGVKLNKDDGTFAIGVRLYGDLPPEPLHFCWRAVRPAQTFVAKEERLMLSPSIYYASRKETVRLEAIYSSGAVWKRGELSFSVRPEGGARIGEDGVFTAYDKPGIYEITVRSVINDKLSATAFIVVN